MSVCAAELSNLLVMRQGVDQCVQPDSVALCLTQLKFHQIKDKEITQVRERGDYSLLYISLSAPSFVYVSPGLYSVGHTTAKHFATVPPSFTKFQYIFPY